MKGKKCIKLLILCITCLLSLKLSLNANALTANVSSAYVDFWSSSANQQVQSNVSLPWGANIGGSPSNKQSFYLNNISMTYPITASASDLSIYGRIVMRFSPSFTSGEDAYFCNYHLNSITNSVSNIQSGCNATITYNYADNTTYSVSLPIYFNYTLPSGALALYVDYNQNLPNTALSSITATFSKTGSWDIYSVTNGYSLILTVEPSDASYYITDSGGNVDISPLVSQNQTIINQNQQIIDNQNQNTQDIIRSNQNCHQSKNIFNKAVASSNVILNWTTGADVSNSGSITSDFIPVTDGVKVRSNYRGAVFFYDSSRNLIGHFGANGSVITTTGGGYFDAFTVPSDLGISYIRYSFRASTNYETSLTDKDIMVNFGETLSPYEPFGEEICQNYNEEISDFLHDNTPPSVDTSSMSNSAGWLPPGPVDSILTLPVVFIQSILSAFNNDACRDVVLPLPYLENKTLTLPCMRPLLNQMGFLTIYEVVGSVISMFVIYNTLKWLYKFVDDTLTFREDNSFGGGI